MYKYWSTLKKHLSFRQGILLAGLLLTNVSQGQTTPKASLITRMPASYVPDDDVIAKPVDNEISLYQKYIASDNSADVVATRNQLKVWSDNQAFADQHGMDTTAAGPYYVPNQEEKWNYFKDKYLMYYKRQGEQPFKNAPKTWYQEYRASNEVDTIDEIEGRFKSNQPKSGSSNSEATPATNVPGLQTKEVNVLKKTKFIFQPRVDRGIVVVGLKNVLTNTYARAWVGVNGRTELNLQQSIDSVGMRIMYNYYADSGKNFTSVDKRIIDNLYARYTKTLDPGQKMGQAYKDDTLMLLYATQF